MTRTRQLLLATLALLVVSISAPKLASAGNWTNCSPSDAQGVKVGATSYFVFKACGFYWYAPTDSEGSRIFSSVVTGAILAGRLINVQCGQNGGSCTSFTTNTYSGSTLASASVFAAESVSMQ